MRLQHKLGVVIGLSILFFFAALSVGMDRSIPGGKWTVALIPLAGGLGGMLASFGFRKVRLFWKALALRWKVASIFTASSAYLVSIWLLNRHKPDESFQDFAGCLFFILVLILWASYSLMSHGLDALWRRLTRR